jgi:hypothetical protein
MPAIDPSESVVLTFDFSAELATGETLTGIGTTTVSVFLGTDSTPASLLNGTPSVDVTGTKVLVPVKGRPTDGVDYDVALTAVPTSNVKKVLAMGCILPVRVV